MNRSFDPLHLVNTYGAFGSVGRVRHEVVVEGTDETVPHPGTALAGVRLQGQAGRCAQDCRASSPRTICGWTG